MKESYYFRHDYNAHEDPKIIRLQAKHGLEGYGVFWYLIELLASETGRLFLPRDYEMLAFAMRTNCDLVKSVIEDFGLFQFDEENFWNNRLDSDNDERTKKSERAKINAEARWGKQVKRKKADKTILYVLEIFNQNESFIKVGITSESVSRRFSGKLEGYEYKLLFQNDVDMSVAIECETACEKFEKYTPYKKFAGSLECYNIICKGDIVNFAMQKTNFAMQKTNFAMLKRGEERRGEDSKSKDITIPANAEKNEPLEEIIRHWNNDFKKKIPSKNRTIAIGENIFKQCRGVTTPLIGEYKKLRKKMSDYEIKQAMFNYAIERNSRDSDNNDYATHCFSLFDFIKQSNGAIKFLNQ